MEYDAIIIGGGAAGLMAAGTAASGGKKVLLLEKMEKPARKVRITGKGRCNITNVKPAGEFLEKVQVNRDFFEPAYAAFDNKALMRFLEKQGVKLSTEQGGRVFPKSGKAWDVAEALVEWCREAGVEIVCNATVEEILFLGDRVRGVSYRTRKGFPRRVNSPAVIVATGGASYPATGSTGDGYLFARQAGHHIEAIRPSLVPLETSHPERNFMTGLLLKNVNASLLIDGEKVAEEFGELSFSARGVEGAVILRLSRMAVDALIDEKRVEISIDLKSALDEETLRERVEREVAALEEGSVMADLLRKFVPKELVMPIAKAIDSHPKREIKGFDEKTASRLICTLKDFRLPINDYRPFEEAVVTAGGVDVGEVNPATMESRLKRGLYFAGEVLDLDANTGGYNLQVAFSTGRLAGEMRHEE